MEWAVIAVLTEEFGPHWPTIPRIYEEGDGWWVWWLFESDPTSYVTIYGTQWSGTGWEPGLDAECETCGHAFEMPYPPEGTRCDQPLCQLDVS